MLTYLARHLVKGDVVRKWDRNWTVRSASSTYQYYDYEVNSKIFEWRVCLSHDQERIILVVDGDESFLVIHPESRR